MFLKGNKKNGLQQKQKTCFHADFSSLSVQLKVSTIVLRKKCEVCFFSEQHFPDTNIQSKHLQKKLEAKSSTEQPQPYLSHYLHVFWGRAVVIGLCFGGKKSSTSLTFSIPSTPTLKV